MLEEPQPVADLVGDPQAVVPDLVRLPEQRHLLGEALLDLGPLVGSQARIVEADELVGDPDVREQDGSPGRLGGVRGEHEPNRGRGRAVDELGRRNRRELLEGILERLAGDDAVVRVLAPASQPVVLLGEVRQLEVEPERAQHHRLLVGGERRRGARGRAVGARAARFAPDRLDELEQPFTLLLDEHGAENRSEHAHVAAKRGGGVAAGPVRRHAVDATSEGRGRRGRRLRRARPS